jgi:hypothetical protein
MDIEVNTLLAASLEALIHQLIYVLNVYPSDSFAKCTFLGIVGQRNRHSGVVDYISNCIRVAVPLLRQSGVVVVVVGQERIVLRLHILGGNELTIALLEARLRDLILAVHALERRKKKEASFQIQVIPASSSECQELIHGMTNGQWYQVNHHTNDSSSSQAENDEDAEASSSTGGRSIRPIYDNGGISLHATIYP